MFQALINKEKKVAVVGLGYVGLPVALAFARHFRVIGFDIDAGRIARMKQGIDPSRELTSEDFIGADIEFTHHAGDLRDANFFIVCVPTDIDESKMPDLNPLMQASESVGKALSEGDYVVFESTVYPGCTEEDCLPLLEQFSGLKLGAGFKMGYSPERINPGDRSRPLAQIRKVVSGSDGEALETIAQVYGQVIEAGVYRAESIKIAEAAKVIENTQRDLNISLMNELAIIFDRMGIDTHKVIEAAGTKWNFLKFYPGLVGGHCIGVDPYYLLHKSIRSGYEPQVILSGRRVNDGMPAWIAKRLLQLLIRQHKNPRHTRVLILGITFKENVADTRNSKVVALVRELQDYFIEVEVFDPLADAEEVAREYNITLSKQISGNYDAVVAAVAHDVFRQYDSDFFVSVMRENPVLMDIKGIYNLKDNRITYWRL